MLCNAEGFFQTATLIGVNLKQSGFQGVLPRCIRTLAKNQSIFKRAHWLEMIVAFGNNFSLGGLLGPNKRLKSHLLPGTEPNGLQQ